MIKLNKQELFLLHDWEILCLGEILWQRRERYDKI